MQAIETTFHSHSTSYSGIMCAIRSKPYSWDLRKKAKISSKNKKKHFWTFYISSKIVQAIETTFYSHSTSNYGTMGAIRSKPYGWDLRKKAKIGSKNTKEHFRIFYISSKTVQAIETTFYSHSTSNYGTMCGIRSKPYSWDLRKNAKISSKNTKKNIFGLFIFPQKLCRRMKRLFTVILHHIPGTTVCAIRSKPYGWDLRKKAKTSSKNTKKKHFWTFYISSKTAGD